METNRRKPSARLPWVELGGYLEGYYIVDEQRPDGSVVLRRETEMEETMRRHGLEPATLEEFEAEYGAVRPPDGEG